MEFLTHPVFISGLIGWFLAQSLKVIFEFLKRKSKKARQELVETFLWRTGGMPSSHSSMVTALTVSVAINNGLDSPSFFISFFFGMIVLRDALGVRRSSGLQAQAINSLGEELKKKLGIEFNPVKEIHGHSPIEVIVGIILGATIALITQLVITL